MADFFNLYSSRHIMEIYRLPMVFDRGTSVCARRRHLQQSIKKQKTPLGSHLPSPVSLLTFHNCRLTFSRHLSRITPASINIVVMKTQRVTKKIEHGKTQIGRIYTDRNITEKIRDNPSNPRNPCSIPVMKRTKSKNPQYKFNCFYS